MPYAAFLVTYNRPQALLETINALFRQTSSPSKILILDNGNLPDDFLDVHFLADERLACHKIGFNAGPAGAAEIGLRLLAAEGFEWIFWGDDNDPPPFRDTIERLLASYYVTQNAGLGMLGMVGHQFNYCSGVLVRSTFENLQGEGILDVDSVAGNQSMLVHRSVVESGILPDPSLFFGFEELDFCLSVKAGGFRIGVDKELFRKCREHFNRTGFKNTGPYKYAESSLWRQYYSTRNLFLIYHKHGLRSAWWFHLLRSLVKLVYNFRYGWNFGQKSWRMISAGLFDGLLGRSGFRQW